MKQDELFQGDLSDQMETLHVNGMRGTPNYWWSQNHSFCFCSPLKFPFSLVGGSRELIDGLLNNKKIETFPVQADTRVDSGSDTINVKL